MNFEIIKKILEDSEDRSEELIVTLEGGVKKVISQPFLVVLRCDCEYTQVKKLPLPCKKSILTIYPSRNISINNGHCGYYKGYCSGKKCKYKVDIMSNKMRIRGFDRNNNDCIKEIIVENIRKINLISRRGSKLFDII